MCAHTVVSNPPNNTTSRAMVSITKYRMKLAQLLVSTFSGEVYRIITSRPTNTRAYTAMPIAAPIMPRFAAFARPACLP